MKIKDLETKLSKIQKELNDERGKFSLISKNIRKLYNEEQKLTTELFMSTKKTDWESILSFSDDESMEIYKYKQNFLIEYCKDMKLTPTAISFSGYIPQTKQSCIRIALYKNNNDVTEKVYSFIVSVGRYILPIQQQYIYITLFEHTLSEHGSYYLYCDLKSNKASLCVNVYHRSFTINIKNHNRNPLNDSKNNLLLYPLEDVLTYIQKHHYYEEDTTI